MEKLPLQLNLTSEIVTAEVQRIKCLLFTVSYLVFHITFHILQLQYRAFSLRNSGWLVVCCFESRFFDPLMI